MIERGSRAGLLFEPLASDRIGRNARGQYLQRNHALQSRIARTIDFPHAAGPEQGDDFIRTDLRTGVEHGEP